MLRVGNRLRFSLSIHCMCVCILISHTIFKVVVFELCSRFKLPLPILSFSSQVCQYMIGKFTLV